MMAVHVTEPDPSPGRNPLDGMLLTTEGDVTAPCALDTVSFYERRGWIKDYLKAMKIGTRIKDRLLDHADDLRKRLIFDAITAYRVMIVERLTRSEPDTLASRIVHRDETGRQRTPHGPPDPELTIEAFAVEVARLAGSIPKRRQPRREPRNSGRGTGSSST